jgi:hypothetical protein
MSLTYIVAALGYYIIVTTQQLLHQAPPAASFVFTKNLSSPSTKIIFSVKITLSTVSGLLNSRLNSSFTEFLLGVCQCSGARNSPKYGVYTV